LLEKHTETIQAMAQAAHGMGEASKAIETAKEVSAKCRIVFERCVRSMRGDKIKIGASRRTCGYASMFYDNLTALGLKPNTCNNYLTSFRASVNEGRVFTLNASRDGVASKKPTVIPPAAESQAGKAVKVLTPDNVRELQSISGDDTPEGADGFLESAGAGPIVQRQPNASVHGQISALIQTHRAGLDQLFMLLGEVHMKGNQDAVTAIREELNRIESEVLEAAKR
jgi:hypothetical protein